MKQFLRQITILCLASYQISCAQEAPPSANERIIFCAPYSDIQIDASLEDWPKSAREYPIEKRFWGDRREGQTDLKAFFRTAYHPQENALYLAIRIQDDQSLYNPESPQWDNQDSYTFYINEQYKRAGSGIVRYALAPDFKEASKTDDHWDPRLADYISWERLDYQIKTEGGQTVYEIKYTLKEPIYAGRTIGLGHMINDQDETSQSIFGWIGRGGKSASAQPGRVGMLVFVDAKTKIGTVNGQVQWKDKNIPTQPNGVVIVSEADESRWIYLPLEDGRFQASLPVGTYRLEPNMRAYFNGDAFYKPDFSRTMSFEVRAGEKQSLSPYLWEALPPKELDFKGNVLYNLDAEGKKKIDQVIRAYLDYYEIDGATFAAWQDGKISYQQNYGYANRYAQEKVQEKTLFEVASITKPVFTFAVMRLYERGIIDLDKPLAEYLPFDLIKDHEYAGLITARHVLSHQTGFPNWARGGRLEFLFKPGTDFGYSGEGFEYLKRVLEQITGKEVNQILQEEVVAPLGLQHFYFQKDPYAARHKSHGHFNGYPGLIDLPEKPWVAGCLVTNATAFMDFARAIHERKGLKAETYAEMLKPQSFNPKGYQEGNWGYPEHMGLGWFVENTPYGQVFRHSGNNNDFRAMFRLYDKLGMAYMLIVNGNSGFYLINQLEKVLVDPEELGKKF